MAQQREPADLDGCEREPIHVPGAIQPHGVLLVLAEPGLTIVQVSENATQHLGRGSAQLLGQPLAALLDPQCVGEVQKALAGEGWDELHPLRVIVDGKEFDGSLQRDGGIALLELEPAGPRPSDRAVSDALQRALKAVERAQSVDQLCEIAVREVKRITGFDRVLIYRFEEDGHGTVLAEAKEASIDAYLGLHYPASDIPEQARALYLKSWLRIIPDARYVPVPIVPSLRPDTGAPLDLSFSVLRSVSPVHLEYLANMGVRASMSISLIVRDRLWGLISCGHHAGPRFVPYELRSTAEILGRLMSLQLSAFADREATTQREALRPRLDVLATAMRQTSVNADVLTALIARPRELLSLVNAAGAVVLTRDEPLPYGQVPSRALIDAIANWLDERGEHAPFFTDALPSLLPAAAAEKDVASGLLTIALPGTPRRRLLWFRPELVRTVQWGGDPTKAVQADASTRLHPRRSFELWKEQVQLHARPWEASEREAAEELRRRAVEIDLGCQVLREQRAVRARDDLVAVVSHDLRNPLGVVQMQAALISRAADTAREDEPSRRLRASAERIQRAVDRMNSLIRDLLDLARIEAGRFQLRRESQRVQDIVDDTLLLVRPLADSKRVLITEEVEDGPLDADRDRAFQVLSNLIGNAIKFTPEGGAIVLRARPRGREVLFTIADTGPGIPSDQLPHVFDRYWQARRSGHEGTGLGLYIAKGIVEAHGGRIWAESPPGSGARLHFSLPAAPAAAGA